jgi:glycerophosphoryl diester phosphodiesterase
MDTVKLINKKNCKMIAHRGLSYIECENSMPAFVAAGNRSYYGIETDVHVTADGKFVIIHDDSTGRVAAGRDLSVEGNNFDLLRGVELADKNGLTGRTDLRIPSLEEYITVCARYDKVPVLELKNHMAEEHIAALVDVIRGKGYLEKTVFISFDLANLIELRLLLPEQKLMYLTGAFNEKIFTALKDYRLDFDVHYSILTPEIVATLHKNGIEVNAWTCDDVTVGEKLVEMGVDYITSNMLE